MLAALALLTPPASPGAMPAAAAQETEEGGVADTLRPRSGETLALAGGARIAPGTWFVPPAGDEAAVLRVEGARGGVLDLREVVLDGAAPDTPPERRIGIGVELVDCEGLVVLGGTLRGFRVGISALRCRDLVVEGVRIEHFFAEKLVSTETLADRVDRLDLELSPAERLLRYGAAIALANCQGGHVSGCRARHGQNGLLARDVSSMAFYDNDFSFLSGWGVFLDGARRTTLSNSRLDYVARGFSFGSYAVDHGAAGLIARRCEELNLVGLSALHCSQGIQLQGGRGNLLLRCDVSHAVLSGLETQGERNLRVVESRAMDCGQAGFSLIDGGTLALMSNVLQDVRGPAVRVRGAEDVVMLHNVIRRSEIGFELGREGDLAPRSIWVQQNSFAENDNDLLVNGARDVLFRDNVFPSTLRELSTRNVTDAAGRALDDEGLREHLGGVGGWLPSGSVASTGVRPQDDGPEPAQLESLGRFRAPEVPGQVREERALVEDAPLGPETLVLSEYGPWDFESGDERPQARRQGGLLANCTWQAAWFSWAGGPDPRGNRENLEAWRGLAQKPWMQAEVGVWESPYGNAEISQAVRKMVGSKRFGLVASTTITLAAGRYRLSTVSDDGVRVLIDGGPVLQNWSWHPATRNSADLVLTDGEHEVKLEYFQIDGATALSVDLVPLDVAPQVVR